MSMSVRCAGCGLEYAGARGLGGLFAAARNLARPAYLRMLAEVRASTGTPVACWATRAAPTTTTTTVTLGAFLAAGGYSRYFVEHFMLPLVVARCGRRAGDGAARYPARYLFAFLRQPRMLAVTRLAALAHGRRRVARATSSAAVEGARRGRPVDPGAGAHPHRRRRGDPRRRRHRRPRRRAVVVATHPDQALRVARRRRPPREREVLGAFRYSRNVDPSCTPTPRCCRAARRAGVVELPQALLRRSATRRCS